MSRERPADLRIAAPDDCDRAEFDRRMDAAALHAIRGERWAMLRRAVGRAAAWTVLALLLLAAAVLTAVVGGY